MLKIRLMGTKNDIKWFQRLLERQKELQRLLNDILERDIKNSEEIKKATELLEKLSDYKPLAKIEELEEQNYNMIDNVLNNGIEKRATKEKTSLKARLEEKREQVAGREKVTMKQKDKKEQKEI